MLLSDLVAPFVTSPPVGWLVVQADLEKWLKTAVRQYSGYAELINAPAIPPAMCSPVDATDSIAGNQDFDITQSEYDIIYPLWMLYIERVNALTLETSRSMGVDVYGRSVSEIETAIKDRLDTLAHDAFYQDIVTI